jgi:hypothetical protein
MTTNDSTFGIRTTSASILVLISALCGTTSCASNVGTDLSVDEEIGENSVRTESVASALNPDDGANPISAISRGVNSIDTFWRGTDNQLHTTSWNGGGWPSRSLGGSLSSAPTALKLTSGHIAVFARSSTNSLLRIDWNGTEWETSFTDYGSPAVPPSPSGTGIDGTGIRAFTALDGVSLTFKPVVLARGSNGNLHMLDFRTGPIPAWVPVTGGGYVGNPALVNCNGTTLMFVRAGDNALKYARWTNSGWTAFVSLGGILTASPTAVSIASNRVDVFVRDTNGALQQKVFVGNCSTAAGTAGWSGFALRSGNFSGDPQAVSRAANRIDRV